MTKLPVPAVKTVASSAKTPVELPVKSRSRVTESVPAGALQRQEHGGGLRNGGAVRLVMPEASVQSQWRTLLRSCRAARNAAFLGPSFAARAAVEVVREADAGLCIKVKAVLASQAAKNEFLTDLSAFDRLLRSHDEFLQEMAGLQARPRRRPPPARRESPPVDAARAVPLVQLLERYGVELRRRGSSLVARCPFHDDTRPSLQVNEQKGLWHCFPCGIGGDGIAFVMRLKAVGFADAIREVIG